MEKSRLHLRADSANGEHTKITVFSNGGNCGQLTMKEEEAVFFHDIVMMSMWARPGEVRTSGIWIKGKESGK